MIDRVTEGIGRVVAWLTLVMGLVTCAVVVLRYGFDIGAIALQESVIYLHATAFMLGIAYTLKLDEHVRVDVLYSRLNARQKAWVDLCGHIFFLLPAALTLGLYSLPYVAASWRIQEGSSEVGGIPAVYLLKTLIPVMTLLLLLQGLAEIARAVRHLRQEP